LESKIANPQGWPVKNFKLNKREKVSLFSTRIQSRQKKEKSKTRRIICKSWTKVWPFKHFIGVAGEAQNQA